MFNTGQVTLPKVWRSQFDTKRFTAQERDGSLVITPIVAEDSTIYYESKDGNNFGIYNEEGIDADKFLASLRSLQDG